MLGAISPTPNHMSQHEQERLVRPPSVTWAGDHRSDHPCTEYAYHSQHYEHLDHLAQDPATSSAPTKT